MKWMGESPGRVMKPQILRWNP